MNKDCIKNNMKDAIKDQINESAGFDGWKRERRQGKVHCIKGDRGTGNEFNHYTTEKIKGKKVTKENNKDFTFVEYKFAQTLLCCTVESRVMS